MGVPGERPRRVGWLAWGLLLVLWTAALVTPRPDQLAGAVLPGSESLLPSFNFVHFAGYAALTALLGWLRPPSPWRWILLGLLLAHGPLAECVQAFVERTPDLWDVGFDWLGIAFGVALTWRRWKT